MNTKDIGNISESLFLHKLLKAGWIVSIPFGENSPYDLVAEKDGKFYRIQIKTGKYKNGRIHFSTVSIIRKDGLNIKVNYINKVDYFGVYCPQLETTYMVPIDTFNPSCNCKLRVDPQKCSNGDEPKWAKDFEF